MEFEITQRIGAPPAAVEAALLDPAFVAATAGLPKLGDSSLVEVRRDGSVVHLRLRRHFTGHLNPAVTAVIDRSKLSWVEELDHDLDRHRAEHRIVPDHYPDRLEASYTSTLTAETDGTRRVASGVLSVRAALVGGRVERAIVSGLDEYAQAEAALLTSWVDDRRPPPDEQEKEEEQ